MVRFPRLWSYDEGSTSPTPVPLSLPSHVRANIEKNVVAFSGIYFVLFFSSLKVLLNERKTISSATQLLTIAGVLGILITWVSISHVNTLLSGDGSHWAISLHSFPDSMSSRTRSE